MPKAPLDVPWDRIQEAAEKGVPLTEIAKLYGINADTIRVRSGRKKWATPKRLKTTLDKASGLQNRRVAENAATLAQLTDADQVQNPTGSATIDLETLSKEYQGKAARKLFTLINSSVILPPRNWKDLDIADKMMRRTLGLDDNEGKITSVVQLQVVNDRLRESLSTEILEGELVLESVREVSEGDPLQSGLTGSESAPPLSETRTTESETPAVGCTPEGDAGRSA